MHGMASSSSRSHSVYQLAQIVLAEGVEPK